MSTHKATSLGTHGGIDYLREERMDPDEVEANEPKRFRPPDLISNVLNNVLDDVGIGITNPQFTIRTPGLRDRDISFDRSFPKVRVLVKAFTQRINLNGEERDEAMLAELAEHKTYAEENDYTFLPVINGQINRDDLTRVRQEVTARRKLQEPEPESPKVVEPVTA